MSTHTWFTMITLLSPQFVLQEVTEDNLALASLAWGFTIGFGWLTTWTAMKQTKHIYERRGLLIFRSAYIWMIWLEILVCLIFSIICWLHLKGILPPRTRVSTDGIRTVRGVDTVSIELQERPDESAAFDGRSKTNRDTEFLGQSSSSSL
ncbi:hypothetical protein AUP68_10745 [Ilyonectria robusta]